MALPNWGTLAGYAAKWLDPVFNKRDRLKRQIASKEKEIKYLESQKSTPKNAALHSTCILERNELRKKLENLKD